MEADSSVKIDNATDADTDANDSQLPEVVSSFGNERPPSSKDGILREGPLSDTASSSALPVKPESDFLETVAGVAGNILEWYDFAVFGFFSDIIGDVCFPPNEDPDDDSKSTAEAFAVFGLAFLMRPIGGIMLGYIGDTYGSKQALILSIFLMAFPTFAMGCLPSYDQVGALSIVMLIIVRLLQGISVGGQLVSSLVFTLESHPRSQWGLYGSFVLGAANFGTLLGGLAAFFLRSTLTEQQLKSWGWRVPFWSGILVSLSGLYLRNHGDDGHGHAHYQKPKIAPAMHSETSSASAEDDDPIITGTSDPLVVHPLRLAFARENLRALGAASLVPMLWSAGFYLSFVWLAVYMGDLLKPPIPGADGVTSAALLISVCLFFPVAGMLSDKFGRRRIMTIGGISMALMSPLLVGFIAHSHSGMVAFLCQTTIGIALSFWAAPMCAWLVESFEPAARVTSVAIGYNVAQAIAGSTAPLLATTMVRKYGADSPGFLLTGLAVSSLTGLWIAPLPKATNFAAVPTVDCEMTNLETSEPDGDAKEPGDDFELI